MDPEHPKEFLRIIDEDYVRYADRLHEGSFTNRSKLSAPDNLDLKALTVPKGPAGLITQKAQRADLQVGGESFGCSSLRSLLLLLEYLLALPRFCQWYPDKCYPGGITWLGANKMHFGYCVAAAA